MVFVLLCLSYFTQCHVSRSITIVAWIRISFLWMEWVIFHFMYMYCIFFVHSSVGGYLGCFHLLAEFVNNAEINVGVQISVWVLVFSSLGYIYRNTRSGISESYASTVFNFFEEQLNCFPQWLRHFSLVMNDSYNSFTFLPKLVIFIF